MLFVEQNICKEPVLSGSADYTTQYQGESQLPLFDARKYVDPIETFRIARSRFGTLLESPVYNPMHDLRQLPLDPNFSMICMIY